MIINKLQRFLPAVIWMFVIYYFSSIPTNIITGTTVKRFIILKSFHLVEYAVLSILIYFATIKYLPAIYISYVYALSDEMHQFFVPGRTSKFSDTLIDLGGILIGIIIIKILISKVTFIYRLLEKKY